MTAIVIGEPYPAELVLRNAAALLVGDGLTLLVHMDRLGLPDHDFAETPGDEDAFRAEIRIHVARFHAFPWVAVEFPLTRLVYDTPLVVGYDAAHNASAGDAAGLALVLAAVQEAQPLATSGLQSDNFGFSVSLSSARSSAHTRRSRAG